MRDFHTHILPGIDDGSKTPEISVEMLRRLSIQGVDAVVATPHFYYDKISVDKFLKYRDLSINMLMNAIENAGLKERPEIAIGSEVKFFYGLDTFERAQDLCIKGTNYMLIEMPFGKWDIKAYAVLARLSRNRDIVPVIAHIERYLHDNSLSTVMKNLIEIGALVQVNTSFITSYMTRLMASYMMKNGLIQFLGTDSHDLDKRKPNYDSAIKVIKKMSNGIYIDDFMFWAEKFRKEEPEWI